MKILFFGNTNNSHVEFIEHLLKNQHQVTHIITQNGDLHDPFVKNRKYDRRSNLKLIDLRGIGEEELILHSPVIEEILVQNFDLAFLEEMGPSYFKYLKCPFISINIGYNTANYMSRDFSINRASVWADDFRQSLSGQLILAKYDEFVNKQREGFLRSSRIMSLPIGVVKSEDTIFSQIGVGHEKFLVPYIPKVNREYRFKTYKRFYTKKQKLRILFAARLDSPRFHPGYSERNDKGVENLFEVLKKLSNSHCYEFAIFNKGLGAQNFIKKLEKFNLLNDIRVMEAIPYPRYLKTISRFDVVIDSVGQSPPGRVTFDALQLGIPIICNLDKASMKVLSDDNFELSKYAFHANTATEILKSLEKILESYNQRSFNLMDLQKHMSNMLDLDRQFSNIFVDFSV